MGSILRRKSGAADLLLFFAAVCIIAGPARSLAETISMETRTQTEVAGNRLKVTVLKTNRGTASAFQVQTHIAVLGRELQAPVKAQLDPEASYSDAFDVDVSPLRKGRYPVIVYTDFHDANRYPFSALSATTFRVGEDARADIILRAEDVDLGNSGHIRIGLKNLAASPVEIRASIHAPREINVRGPEKSLSLEERSESGLDFFVSNFSALENASYAVYCVVEYESDGVHHTEIARLHMKISTSENFFRRYRKVWLALGGVLCLLLVVVVRKGRRGKQSTPKHGEGLGKTYE